MCHSSEINYLVQASNIVQVYMPVTQIKMSRLHCCKLAIFPIVAGGYGYEVVSLANQRELVQSFQRYLEHNAYLTKSM